MTTVIKKFDRIEICKPFFLTHYHFKEMTQNESNDLTLLFNSSYLQSF